MIVPSQVGVYKRKGKKRREEEEWRRGERVGRRRGGEMREEGMRGDERRGGVRRGDERRGEKKSKNNPSLSATTRKNGNPSRAYVHFIYLKFFLALPIFIYLKFLPSI